MRLPLRPLLAALCLSGCLDTAGAAQPARNSVSDRRAQAIQRHTQVDHSGRQRRGTASYYGRQFDDKKMADGRRLNPNADVAASKNLPLGTRARVKNLHNGKSTVVDIEDRGPYAKDRIMDLSPKAAKQLDMQKEGVAPVEVSPLRVPQPDGSVKPGAAAKPR